MALASQVLKAFSGQINVLFLDEQVLYSVKMSGLRCSGSKNE